MIAYIESQKEVAQISGILMESENSEIVQKSQNTGLAECEISAMEAIYYGDCPGLPFLLQIPSAIDSSWPDLDSFATEQMEENLMELKEKPVIIMRKTEPTSASFVEKKELLQDYMSAKHYEAVYENEGYTVYVPLEK